MDTMLLQEVRGYSGFPAVILHEDVALEAVLSHLVPNAGPGGVVRADSSDHITGELTPSTLVN